MLRRCYLALFLCLWLSLGIAHPASAASREPQKELRATAFDQDIVVQTNGSLLVTERITFQFIGGPFTTITRDFKNSKATITSFQNVGMDTSGGYTKVEDIEFNRGRNWDSVTWTFQPLSDTSRTVFLSYYVSDAIQQMSDSDRLQWIALPNEHAYRIDSSTIDIGYPDQARLLADPQEMQGKPIQITAKYKEAIIVSRDFAPNEYMQVQFSFAPGSVIPQESWKLQQRHLLPYLIVPFLLAGILIMAIGLWLLRRRAHKYHQPLPAGTMIWTSIKAPPDNLPPALAGILARNKPDGPSWNLFLGTFFDLLNRNVLAMRETEHTYSWQQEPTRQYWLELLTQPADLLPHEQALLRVLFKGNKKTMDTRIKIHAIRGNYNLHKQWFDSVLQQMVREKDWFDPQRSRSRRPYTYSAIILNILGGAGVILTLILMSLITPYYACLFLLDGPVLILALASRICSSKHSLVYDRYWPLAWQWQQFAAYLPQISSISAIFIKSQAEHIDGYLPYAASFGLAQPWAEHFYQPTRNTLPSWFSTQIGDPEQQHRTFMNLLDNSQLIPLPRSSNSHRAYDRGRFGA